MISKQLQLQEQNLLLAKSQLCQQLNNFHLLHFLFHVHFLCSFRCDEECRRTKNFVCLSVDVQLQCLDWLVLCLSKVVLSFNPPVHTLDCEAKFQESCSHCVVLNGYHTRIAEILLRLIINLLQDFLNHGNALYEKEKLEATHFPSYRRIFPCSSNNISVPSLFSTILM